MKQKLVCDTVKDLLPVYIEQMASEASARSIEEHMRECAQCRDVFERMKAPVEADKAPEVKEFGRFLKKSRLSILWWILGAAALLAVVVCFIVNLAVEGRLSWFYIVAGSILTACLPAYMGIRAEKHRFVKMAGTLQVCVVLLLGIIQYVLYSIMHTGTIWIFSIGLPITALWSLIVWTGILCSVFLKMTPFLSLSAVCFLSIFGNLLTNFIADNYVMQQNVMEIFLDNVLGCLAAGVVLLIVGLKMQARKKSGEA